VQEYPAKGMQASGAGISSKRHSGIWGRNIQQKAQDFRYLVQEYLAKV
jgi:hypothetical protein